MNEPTTSSIACPRRLEHARTQRRPSWTRPAPATRTCGSRSKRCLRAHERRRQLPADQPRRATVDRHPRTAPAGRRPGHGHRPVQAAGADRRRRHGHRLHGRADRAGPPPGRLEDHQAGHGHPAGPRPLRGRAAGAGPDGPSEHRQGARRRHDRRPAGPTSSWNWSRACRSPSTATSTSLTPAAAAGAVHPGLPGGAARPPEGHHPPRPQAVQRAGRPVRRQAGAQGDRLRRGQGDRAAADRQDAVHRLRRQWSARRSTCRPEQAETEPARHRHAQRHLLAGRAPVRAADRQRRRSAARSWKKAGMLEVLRRDPRGGAAEAEHAAEHGGGLAVARRQPRHWSRRS